MAPKRRRSERGPISLAVRVLLELPDTIVEEILRLVDTGRYLVHKPPPRGFGGSFARPLLPWAGTQRMVTENVKRHNRHYLVDRFWRPSGGLSNSPEDHMFAIQFPQPLVY